jgi:hypothetical protein
MESRKIQRLEFISDKIEGGDCKREVICIGFGHPTKKNEFVWGSPWEGSHGWAQGPLVAAWQASGRGREGRGRGHGWGCSLGRGGLQGGRHGCSALRAAVPLLCSLVAVLLAWEETGRRKKRTEKKRKGRKRKEKKYEKISKLENFWGEK